MDHAFSHLSTEELCIISVQIMVVLVENGVQQKSRGMDNGINGGIVVVVVMLQPPPPPPPQQQQQQQQQ